MGELIDLPNITPDSIVFDDNKEERVVKPNSNFDIKNYLNVRLKKDETEKTITIRLLPMDLKTGNPFVKVHLHNVQVPKDMVNPGDKPYKSYICLSKNPDINHEKFGNNCPYCELNRAAYLESTKTDDPIKKKQLQKLSTDSLAKEGVICRCIERGKEDEGVKFWKFNVRYDKTDPYNQILNLYKMRKESAEKKGKTENILDIYEGRDLNVTITSEGTSAPTIIDDSDRSPLSDDKELMKKWIYDKKTWQDVFTCKPYDYLNLVAQMKVPWYDRASNSWVDKAEIDKKKEEEKNHANEEIENAEKAITDMIDGQTDVNTVNNTTNRNNLVESLMINDDDLPL
jgi:hypothetical protein